MPIELCRRIAVHLSPEVYARLEIVAGPKQRTVSDIVRHAMEGLLLQPRRRTREYDAWIRQLIRVGNHLTQQTCLLQHLLEHRGDFPDSEILLATPKELAGPHRSVSGRMGRREPRTV